MNKKEVSEIKRRFHPEHANITCIRGCYVSKEGQVISTFSRPLIGMAQDEAEKYLSIFKHTLSGDIGQSLINLDFSPEQVMSAQELKLLMGLRNTALKDDDLVNSFFEHVIPSVHLDENYLILLMHDGYDIPYRTKDDRSVQDMSTEVFHYILCSVCPVKLEKSALSYFSERSEFHIRDAAQNVMMPELGFMYPSFDDRSANVYGALYYSKDLASPHDEFVLAALGGEVPMPAQVQKETFRNILQDALSNDLNLDVVQTVHEKVRDKIEEQKADKAVSEPVITKDEVKEILEDCGVQEKHVAAFEQKYEQEFGKNTALNAVNVVSPKQFTVKAPGVVIKVDPARSDLVETRVINGLKYILIRADENVEVNGVNVSIVDPETGEIQQE